MIKSRINIDMNKMKMTQPEVILKNLELRPYYGKDNSKSYVHHFMKRGEEISEMLRKDYRNCNYLVGYLNYNTNTSELSTQKDKNEYDYEYLNNYIEEDYFTDSSLDDINDNDKNYYYSDTESSDSMDDYD